MKRFIKRIFLALSLAAFLTALPGCGGTTDTVGEKTEDGAKEAVIPVEEALPLEEGDIPVEEDALPANDSRYTWQEMTIILPKDWEECCVMIENEQGFSIYQKASYEKDNTMGYVCGFCRTGEPEKSGNGALIAYREDGMLYYLIQPFDVSCDTEDEEIAGEYVRMCQQVPQIIFQYYDGILSYIGNVFGFPFAEQNGGLNGFDGAGGITGRQRMDLIETAYPEGFWWYHGSRIICQDLDWYELPPDLGHTLYENLTVHTLREESSAVSVIPAGEQVFFLGSDMQQWILVKGKDGTRGYISVQDGRIVEMDKPASQVFSDLNFSD